MQVILQIIPTSVSKPQKNMEFLSEHYLNEILLTEEIAHGQHFQKRAFPAVMSISPGLGRIKYYPVLSQKQMSYVDKILPGRQEDFLMLAIKNRIGDLCQPC